MLELPTACSIDFEGMPVVKELETQARQLQNAEVSSNASEFLTH